MGEKMTRTQQKNLERFGGVNPADAPNPRRQFLKQVGVGTAAVGAAAGVGALIADPWGMKGVEPPPPVRLKDYSVGVPIGRPSLVVARSTPPSSDAFEDADALYLAREDQALTMVRAALEEMGGVEHFIAKGDVVVIKPNVAFDKNPDLAATTQPDTVSAVVKLCLAGRRQQGDRLRQSDQQPRELLLQDPRRRRRPACRGDLDVAEIELFRAARNQRRDDHRDLEHVLRPLPARDQGHRHQPGEGPQSLARPP